MPNGLREKRFLVEKEVNVTAILLVVRSQSVGKSLEVGAIDLE